MEDALLNAPTVWALLRQRAAATPSAPLATDAASGQRLSCAEAVDAAERLAAGFFARGMRPGSVVTWQLPTGLTAFITALALARLGVVQNPIISLYGERETRAVLERNRPAFYLVPGAGARDFPAMARSLQAELVPRPEVIVMDGELPQGDPAALPAPPTDGRAVRWIYTTSGTTSEPKGVRHTDESLLIGGRNLALSMQVRASDVGSIAFPMAHIGGAMYTTMLLASGASVVLLERFVPADAVATFRRHGVTAAGGSTAHYVALLAEQRKQPGEPLVPTLRLLSGGGAPKPPELFHDAKREMNVTIVHCYGMTEVPLLAAGCATHSDEQLAFSDGVPVRDIELKIVRTDGQRAAVGESGEVRVRGAGVFKGYTEEALNAAAFDDEGYFRTGDLGLLRPDGHVALTGRLKDLIIRKGENISAKEIEDLLYTHPKVGAVAVIGLPDRERGERVCAVVEPAPGAEALSFDEMVAFLKAAELMRQKIPEQLEVVDRLPRNETLNKVLKHVLRDRFAAVA